MQEAFARSAKPPCGTCEGTGQLTPPEGVGPLLPCPACTTEKQGEAANEEGGDRAEPGRTTPAPESADVTGAAVEVGGGLKDLSKIWVYEDRTGAFAHGKRKTAANAVVGTPGEWFIPERELVECEDALRTVEAACLEARDERDSRPQPSVVEGEK